MKRREFLYTLAAAGAAATVPLTMHGEAKKKIRAVAFDGFALFDPRSVVSVVEEQLPGKGEAFTAQWRMRQFEYTWLRTAGNRYVDFWQVTEEALRFTAASLKITLSGTQHDALMNAYKTLPLWPDVSEALHALRSRGVRLVILSNLTAAMLDKNLAGKKLEGVFEPHLSTDLVRAFKPSPRAYAMGPEHLGLRREEIAFAAFAGWDAAGAKWFGYPTVWINRANAPVEELDVQPDVITPDMSGLLKFVEDRT